MNRRSSQPPLDASREGSPQRPSDRPFLLVRSTDLLKGMKAVGIVHNGSIYRLQATKLGKLILTK